MEKIQRSTSSYTTHANFSSPCSLDDNQHIDTPHGLSNHVKETLNMDSASQKLTGVDHKRETAEHGPSLMEVDWRGGIKPNHTTCECISLKLIGEIQVSSFISSTLNMIESQRTSSPKDCWEDYHIEHLLPLMEYLKDSLDTGQTEGGFFNFKSIKEYRDSYSLPDHEHLESRYNLLTEWDPGEKTWKPKTNTMADFKPCGNLKARLVVDGHLNKEPTEIVHSGVLSLRNFRLVMLTAQPNNFQLWGADDESANLQALTKEKLCIVADPAAQELKEHGFAIYKAPMVQHLEEHVAMTSLLTSFNQWTSCNIHSSGREEQVSSLPRQRGVTEFSS